VGNDHYQILKNKHHVLHFRLNQYVKFFLNLIKTKKKNLKISYFFPQKPNRIISKPEPKPRISVLKETKKNRECENPFFKDFAGGDRISLPTNTKNPNALREKILQARFSKRMASQNDIKISTEKMVKPDLRRNQSLNAVPRPQEKENGFFVFKH